MVIDGALSGGHPSQRSTLERYRRGRAEGCGRGLCRTTWPRARAREKNLCATSGAIRESHPANNNRR